MTIRPHFGSVSTRVDAHLAPVGLELVGEDAGERGADVLAHLGADDVDGDDAVAIDAVPDGRLERAAADPRRPARSPASAREAEREAGAGQARSESARRVDEAIARIHVIGGARA